MKRIFFGLLLVLLISMSVSAIFAASNPYPVSVTITPDQPTILVGKNIQLKAAILSNLGKKMLLKVNWSCITGGKINNLGIFTPVKPAQDAKYPILVPVTVTIAGTQISDTINVRIIPIFTGTYIGRFESSDVSGMIAFCMINPAFKVLFLPDGANDFSISSSGQIKPDGTIFYRIKSNGTTIDLDLAVWDGQNLDGGFTATYYDDNHKLVSFDAAVDTQKNIKPNSGGYYGYWYDKYKGRYAIILDDSGKTYNLAELANSSFYFEGSWSGTSVNAELIDPGGAGKVNLIGKIYSRTIKGNITKTPTTITATKIN